MNYLNGLVITHLTLIPELRFNLRLYKAIKLFVKNVKKISRNIGFQELEFLGSG
jgi:hypothetical protein